MSAEHSTEILRAADRLRAGGIVAFPTETVYGLGADARQKHAVQHVFTLKNRPACNPLIVHVAGAAMALRVAPEIPPRGIRLIERFWPGPLTIVAPRGEDIPPIVTASGETVALRAPDHPIAQALITTFDGPIVGPSANHSGRISPTRAEHVRAAFADAIARDELLLLEGGPCRSGIESTVVDVSSGAPRILRRGAVSIHQIEEALGERVEDAAFAREPLQDAPLPSPGMLTKHYAPASASRLFEAEDWPEILPGAETPVVVLSHHRTRSVEPPHLLLRMPMQPEAYAARLYDALHEADALAPTMILIERPAAEGPLWDAIRDRLVRAAAP